MTIALQIIFATIIATTLMTGFSYLISALRGKQFREPVLLNKVVDRWVDFSIYSHYSNPIGWVLHYLVGLIFVVVYHLLWQYTPIEANWLSAAIFGAVSGLVGIAIWMVTFLIHPNPPKVHLLGFFSQLFFAHVIFGLGAYTGYMLPVWWQ